MKVPDKRRGWGVQGEAERSHRLHRLVVSELTCFPFAFCTDHKT